MTNHATYQQITAEKEMRTLILSQTGCSTHKTFALTASTLPQCSTSGCHTMLFPRSVPKNCKCGRQYSPETNPSTTLAVSIALQVRLSDVHHRLVQGIMYQNLHTTVLQSTENSQVKPQGLKKRATTYQCLCVNVIIWIPTKDHGLSIYHQVHAC